MPARRTIIVDLVTEILAAAVPEIEGRVFHQVDTPFNGKRLPCALVLRGDESVEPHDEAPPTAKRTLNIEVTPIVKGIGKKASAELEQLHERVGNALRELQLVPAMQPGEPCLIDDFREVAVSAEEVFKSAEQIVTAVTITYQAIYITDEGTDGEDLPGVPAVNIAAQYKKAVTRWLVGDGISRDDEINYEEE